VDRPKATDYFLDITSDVCPLTLVRTKLLIERMLPGETLELRLNAGEPLENVPAALREQGHRILHAAAEGGVDSEGVHRIYVEKR
jgi:TusA-related sulfurtransferase